MDSPRGGGGGSDRADKVDLGCEIIFVNRGPSGDQRFESPCGVCSRSRNLSRAFNEVSIGAGGSAIVVAPRSVRAKVRPHSCGRTSAATDLGRFPVWITLGFHCGRSSLLIPYRARDCFSPYCSFSASGPRDFSTRCACREAWGCHRDLPALCSRSSDCTDNPSQKKSYCPLAMEQLQTIM